MDGPSSGCTWWDAHAPGHPSGWVVHFSDVSNTYAVVGVSVFSAEAPSVLSWLEMGSLTL